MIKQKDHFHGSDLEKIEQIYGIRKEELISFSANVNPLGISPLLREALIQKIDTITAYPDREYTSLRRSIAAYCGTTAEHVLVGSGATELISLFIQLTRPKKALVLGPTYSEYEREIALGGGQTIYYPLSEKRRFRLEINDFLSQLDETLALLVICNPNNPTSSSVDKSGYDTHLRHLPRPQYHYVMIDETYIEFAEDMDRLSSVPLTDAYPNLIVLRGTSKFFAAPGLRLGYAIAGSLRLIDEINARKNPWTIHSLAAAAGETMFRDTAYIRKTKTLIASERTRIYSLLSIIRRSTPMNRTQIFCFWCASTGRNLPQRSCLTRALRQGMMIRDCSDFPFLNDSYLRFCFMLPEQNDRLLSCLLAWIRLKPLLLLRILHKQKFYAAGHTVQDKVLQKRHRLSIHRVVLLI